LNCAICNFILPHGNLAELNCKNELLKHFERSLILAKDEIRRLKREIKQYEEFTYP